MKYIALAVSAVLVGIDQFFKYLAIVYLSDQLTMPIWTDVFHLTYIENRGAAFSLLEGKRFFLVILTSLVILFGIYLILAGKIKNKFLLWSVALGIGGGIGNVVDRIFRGYVVDYLDLRIIKFAIFNFADCCVVIATIMIMIYILFIYKDKTMIEKNELAQPMKDESADV